MNPQNYMLGIRDVFSILVPGAALMLLLDIALGVQSYPGAIAFLAFAIVAYLFGSLAFAVGGFFDDWASSLNRWYLRRRPWTRAGQEPSTLERVQYHQDYAAALQKLVVINAAAMGEPVEGAKVGHTKGFWWDQLRINCPPAIAELDRLESIQKLFRSLFVVLLAASLIWAALALFDPCRSSPIAGPSATVRQPLFPLYALPAAILSFLFYVRSRWRFDAAVYRLAGAFMLAPHTLALAKSSAAPSQLAGQDDGKLDGSS
jgi:hypothetical protein